MIALFLALAAMQGPAAAPPPGNTAHERLRAANVRAIEASRLAGDPARPFERERPGGQSYLDRELRDLTAQRPALAGRDGPASPALRTFISPSAPTRLRGHGCDVVAETPAGVVRDDGAYNGYRTLATCRNTVMDVLEFDYRQPLTQQVMVHLPLEAVNAHFGPGRATALYYISPNGERTTAFTWYDDSQEVSLRAIGPANEDMDSLAGLMSSVVTGRLADGTVE